MGISCVSHGSVCSPGRKGAGAGRVVGKHLLDNLAVCCRNIASCIVDVASHNIVGEVRLQNNVLRVHMHLKMGTEGKGIWLGAVLHLVTTEGGGEAGQTDRHRGDRETLMARHGEMQRQ